ncbi:MAG: ABC transporter permease [Chloroflexi bacterium]|nr:ABC transporter permease [Chloroflexota bacterium]
MARYAVQRLILVIPTLLGMTLLIFGLVRLLPGDVVQVMSIGDVAASDATRERVRQALGLADPLPVQYAHYLGGLVSGDTGKSFLSGQPVSDILGRAIPITLELAVVAAAFAILVGMPLGVVSAVKQNTRLDFVARVGGLVGLSLPNFWIATLGLLLTSVAFHWIPAVTWIPLFADPLGNLVQIALPAFALSLTTLAIVMRMTRASLLETLHEDYVRTARAKGLAPRPVVMGHGLRNALIPVVTVIGTQVGGLMGGAVIIEVIFGLPGVGYSLVQAIYNRDYPIIQVAAVYLAAVFVLVNLGVDLLYGIIDPRIKQH